MGNLSEISFGVVFSLRQDPQLSWLTSLHTSPTHAVTTNIWTFHQRKASQQETADLLHETFFAPHAPCFQIFNVFSAFYFQSKSALL